MKAAAAIVLMIVVLSGCVVVTWSPGTPSPSGTSRTQQARNGYSFLHTHDDGEPVRWSTCEPIAYVVRPQGRPEGADRLLRESVERISEATGLEFAYEGRTDEVPGDDRKAYQPHRYGDRWAPVLIAYSGPDEYARDDEGVPEGHVVDDLVGAASRRLRVAAPAQDERSAYEGQSPHPSIGQHQTSEGHQPAAVTAYGRISA